MSTGVVLLCSVDRRERGITTEFELWTRELASSAEFGKTLMWIQSQPQLLLLPIIIVCVSRVVLSIRFLASVLRVVL
jgi:hypothetical protein